MPVATVRSTHSPRNSMVVSLAVPPKSVTGAMVSRTSLMIPKLPPSRRPSCARCGTRTVRENDWDTARGSCLASTARSGAVMPSLADADAAADDDDDAVCACFGVRAPVTVLVSEPTTGSGATSLPVGCAVVAELELELAGDAAEFNSCASLTYASPLP